MAADDGDLIAQATANDQTAQAVASGMGHAYYGLGIILVGGVLGLGVASGWLFWVLVVIVIVSAGVFVDLWSNGYTH